ncbi:MAG: dienelactone hydrolase family protein [Owenweeksia sp.]|nr:dienelactone hydrolase family protein [Owenweeksia sp.]
MNKYKTLLTIAAFLTSFSGFSQKMACCSQSAPQQFASLGNDVEFRGSHSLPRTSEYKGDGKMVIFSTPDGKEAKAFLIPARVPTNKWVIVFHEWWGLNNNIKNEAQKLHGDLDEINILALDLYDGPVAEDRDKAREYMQNAKDGRIRNIINGAITYAGEGADIGTIGWCYGGGWSLQAAIMLGDKADGCVMYYGMPELEVDKLEKLQTPVLGIFAKNDSWITPEKVDQFRQSMQEAQRELEVITFDANHAFANPSNENYSNVAAGKAYSAAVSFLRGHLNLAN